MKILLTLDYELFLGNKTGSVQNCLITPVDKMLSETGKYGVRFTLFVDAIYIYQLKKFSTKYSSLKDNFEQIKKHLASLQQKGHDIQLHIHPHWYYSEFDGMQWIPDRQHYKLSDLTENDADTIFKIGKQELEEITGESPIAFRAGGFSAQPTNRLTALFKAYNIKIDSSVCPGCEYDSSQQKYDYRACPNKDLWRFGTDICAEDTNAPFLEMPITMSSYSPQFYWKLALTRLLKQSKHKTFGDGQSIRATSESIRQRIFKHTLGMATIDGLKIDYLKKIYEKKRESENQYFCIIGHPKLATPHSIKKLGEFYDYANKMGDEFIIISDCIK